MSQTTHKVEFKAVDRSLYFALDLGWTQWHLAFTTEVGQKPRLRTIQARDLSALQEEIRRAKERFNLPAQARVASCFEAGRDGFWLHRYLLSIGVESRVVDSSSIEVNRRRRRAKTDKLDAIKLVDLLRQYESGERKKWSVVRVPSVAAEDLRQLGRELESLKKERTEHSNRIRALLAAQGVDLGSGASALRRSFDLLRLWDGSELPPVLRARLEREQQRMEFVEVQIRELEQQRQAQVKAPVCRAEEQVGKLLQLRAVGIKSAWLFVSEFFSWRELRNRRQVGSLAGLAPTPYTSGNDLRREQGISKAGNPRIRAMAIEISWGWLRWQPDSELSRWFLTRFGKAGGRSRKVGIVALARKLLVALWRYLETGVVPAGAQLKPA
jgi:transposase